MLAFPALILMIVSAASAAGAPPPLEDGFVSMFNGKDLAQWTGKPGGWRVEEGALTAESTEAHPCVKHHYLTWAGGEPANFVLRFRYKMIGGNSGVQIRSEPRPGFDTWGYQADIEAAGQWTGCLFQHDREAVVLRGFRAVIAADGTRTDTPFATPESLLAKVRAGDWNDYEVEANGARITLRINGELMCEVEDHDAKMSRKKGLIALQMHPGPPMKIQFKDLRIQILD
ncbi:MAG: DUF1080 domain-containing protein [Candidatus Hydrogenedentes bacterium]|nr:DUF1080 domain-containing protein [Candidatus Hydrogenedentota bacterium]